MYPDQSLYPYDSAPKLVETMNNSLIRADQIQHMELQDGDMKKKIKLIICCQSLLMVKQDLVDL